MINFCFFILRFLLSFYVTLIYFYLPNIASFFKIAVEWFITYSLKFLVSCSGAFVTPERQDTSIQNWISSIRNDFLFLSLFVRSWQKLTIASVFFSMHMEGQHFLVKMSRLIVVLVIVLLWRLTLTQERLRIPRFVSITNFSSVLHQSFNLFPYVTQELMYSIVASSLLVSIKKERRKTKG